MLRKRAVLCTLSLLAFCLAALPTQPANASSPSATAYYEAAIAAMQRLPEPNAAIFTTRFTNDGLHFGLMQGSDNTTDIAVTIGSKYPPNDTENYRTWMASRDNKTLSVDAKARRYYSSSPIFVPTWSGAYDFIRYGWDGKPPKNAASKPAPTPPPGIKTIAVVSALSPGAYHIEDRGPALCPNGAPGHALHLTPRFDPENHQLSDVTIDASTMRFCSMRFGVNESIIAIGLIGYIEMHFAQAGKYWLVHDTHIHVSIRSFGVQVKSGSTAITYHKMNFPAAIPANILAVPTAH